MDVLQFEGTDKFFIGLLQNEDKNKNKKYYLFFANVGSININTSLDDDFINGRYIHTSSCTSTIEFELIENLKNNSMFTIIEINSVEEYEKIVKVIKLLLF